MTECSTKRSHQGARGRVVTLEEFLISLPDYRLERRTIVHGHCHQKALVGMEPKIADLCGNRRSLHTVELLAMATR